MYLYVYKKKHTLRINNFAGFLPGFRNQIGTGTLQDANSQHISESNFLICTTKNTTTNIQRVQSLRGFHMGCATCRRRRGELIMKVYLQDSPMRGWNHCGISLFLVIDMVLYSSKHPHWECFLENLRRIFELILIFFWSANFGLGIEFDGVRFQASSIIFPRMCFRVSSDRRFLRISLF